MSKKVRRSQPFEVKINLTPSKKKKTTFCAFSSVSITIMNALQNSAKHLVRWFIRQHSCKMMTASFLFWILWEKTFILHAMDTIESFTRNTHTNSCCKSYTRKQSNQRHQFQPQVQSKRKCQKGHFVKKEMSCS